METTNVETFEISKNFENSAEISGENHHPQKPKKIFVSNFRQKFLQNPDTLGKNYFGSEETL